MHPAAAVAPGFLANHAARVFNRLVDRALRHHGLSLSLVGPIMLLFRRARCYSATMCAPRQSSSQRWLPLSTSWRRYRGGVSGL